MWIEQRSIKTSLIFNSTILRPIHTRGFALGACSRSTLREQSSSVCTNDFMGIIHPRVQNFHPAKCSTIFNRLNTWEQAPGANNAPSCVLTRAKWSWSMLWEQNPSCVSAFSHSSYNCPANGEERGDTDVFAGKDTMKQEYVTHDCSKSYYSIEYSIRVPWPRAVDMQ